MQKGWATIWRCCLLHIIFMMWMSCIYAQDSALTQVYQWSSMNGTVYSLLNEVSKKSGLLFIYDSTIVDNEKRVKIKEGQRSVKAMIMTVLNNPDLELKQLGKHILITIHSEYGNQPHECTANPDTLPSHLLLRGLLTDKLTGKPLSNASIFLPSVSLGTVSNSEGRFQLRIPYSLRSDTLCFSHLGYEVCRVEAQLLTGDSYIIQLKQVDYKLQEILIRQIDPRTLIRKMIASRASNLSDKDMQQTVFYRECVEYKHKFQQLSEAVFHIYKTPFNSVLPEQVRMVKGNKINNLSSKDSLQVKISAGIESCLLLDIVKYLPDFLLIDENDNPFLYTADGIDMIDGRWVNVVRFVQHKVVKSPLYCGKLYFDSETNALLHASFELNPKYVDKTGNHFITKRSRQYKLVPQSIGYSVSYKNSGNQHQVAHIRGDLRFKVKRNGLFTSSPLLYTWFEMVTCDVQPISAKSFPRSDRINPRSVFLEMNEGLDESFWEDYNIIPLESELSRIIQQVNLRVENRD